MQHITVQLTRSCYVNRPLALSCQWLSR